MVEYAASGELLDGIDDLPLPDPAPMNAEAPSRTVRAAVLRHLLTETKWTVDPKGVRLRRLRISGHLDLEAAAIRCPLWLNDCDLDDPRPVALDFATIPVLVLNRCRLAGLSGSNLASAAKLDFQDSVFTGALTLHGARIDGALECRGARLGANQDGISLSCNGMNVRLSVHLGQGFTARGAVMLPRVNIGGELICPDAHMGANKLGSSLEAPGLRVGGAAYFDAGFSAQGAVRLTGASIGGQLRCDGAHVGADANGNSLLCDGLRTGRSAGREPRQQLAGRRRDESQRRCAPRRRLQHVRGDPARGGRNCRTAPLPRESHQRCRPGRRFAGRQQAQGWRPRLPGQRIPSRRGGGALRR